eukprot:6321018-Amphidinium_carterae.1
MFVVSRTWVSCPKPRGDAGVDNIFGICSRKRHQARYVCKVFAAPIVTLALRRDCVETNVNNKQTENTMQKI